MVHKKNMSSI